MKAFFTTKLQTGLVISFVVGALLHLFPVASVPGGLGVALVLIGMFGTAANAAVHFFRQSK